MYKLYFLKLTQLVEGTVVGVFAPFFLLNGHNNRRVGCFWPLQVTDDDGDGVGPDQLLARRQ